TCCWCGDRCRGQADRTFLSARQEKRSKAKRQFISLSAEKEKEIMPVVDVVNLDGKKVGQVELADAIFGAKVNQHLLHEASRWHLGGLRAGTHKVKEKSEVGVAGGTWRKPQPGTREPQRSSRHAGRAECSAALRRAEA